MCSHRHCDLSHPANLCGSVVMGSSHRIVLKYASWVTFISDWHTVHSWSPAAQTQDSKPPHKVLLLLERSPFPPRSWSVAGASGRKAIAQGNTNVFEYWNHSCNGHPASKHLCLLPNYSKFGAGDTPLLCSSRESMHTKEIWIPWGRRKAKAAAMPVPLRFHPHSTVPCI